MFLLLVLMIRKHHDDDIEFQLLIRENIELQIKKAKLEIIEQLTKTPK